jgi:hypothetical protein
VLCDSDEFKYLKAQDTGVDCCISLWFWFFLVRKQLANLERTTAIIIKERGGNKGNMTGPPTITSVTIENNRPTPTESFDSRLINSGDSFSFVFDKAGEYGYYSTIHTRVPARSP